MAEARSEYWGKVIAEQGASGQSVRGFCKERGVSVQSFYLWRRRLASRSEPVEFAVLETTATTSAAQNCALELILSGGERLRIGNGVDALTLRLVLDAMRQ